MLLIIGILFALMSEVQVDADLLKTEAKEYLSDSKNESIDTTCQPSFAAFSSSGVFVVPCGVFRVKVLVVGGGSGGGSGSAGGGSSGFVKSETVKVYPLINVSIIIGKGGAGSTRKKNNCTQDSQPGGDSAFYFFLSAAGGRAHNGSCYESWRGSSGGSGGGAGCKGSCRAGAGGSGGSAGNKASNGMSWGAGSGSGNFSFQLNKFILNRLTAGAGGKGKFHLRPGGGGGGGVLLNNAAPVAAADDGEGEGAAKGGIGYGAGGGSGQTVVDDDDESQQENTAGGKGADGLVYVEWNDAYRRTPSVPSAEYSNKCPATFAIFTTNGEFRVPCGVSRVRVLVVGGGSGGGSGNAGGGASGFIRGGEYRVEPGKIIPITVGKGGSGSTFKINDWKQDSKAGGKTSFGSFVSAEGGGKDFFIENASSCDFVGQTGGSGGGAGCSGPCWSGNGGSDGSAGSVSIGGISHGNGSGQGSFAAQLGLFKQNVLTVGAAGNGVVLDNPGGGGAGGVLVNVQGPNGTAGLRGGAYGGKGYGAGGGGGFLNISEGSWLFHAGGNGADGLVYIEWWWNDENRLMVDIPADLSVDTSNNETCTPPVAIYESNGTFQVPWHVTRVSVLVVGGGQGGFNGPLTGGSSGQTSVKQIAVKPREIIAITVGNGGTSSFNEGSGSLFGNYLSAGGSGGSGGGQGCHPNCRSGAGGSDGSRGKLSSGQGSSSPNGSPGSGQGSYAGQLSVFTYNRITPGDGGNGTNAYGPGGGGGGGLLINGRGPASPAANGTQPSLGGGGGKGYGAGGGAGGGAGDGVNSWYSGGKGANGLVYIEW